MLTTGLIHPEILGALAAAGHGSGVLISDGNYPHETAPASSAKRVYLNLRPGLVSVADVLSALLTVLPIESAAVMVPPDGVPPPIHATLTDMLTPAVPVARLKRQEFYDATADRNLALVIATGDQAHYANLLLTIGVVAEA